MLEHLIPNPVKRFPTARMHPTTGGSVCILGSAAFFEMLVGALEEGEERGLQATHLRLILLRTRRTSRKRLAAETS